MAFVSLKQLPARLLSKVSRLRETFAFATCFRGKRVVLIGPNARLGNDLQQKVASSDLLVVVNKGHRSETFHTLKPYARRTVLFHCLDFSEHTGGGELSVWDLRKKGIHEVYYPLYEQRYFPNIVHFHRLNTTLLKLYRIDNSSYSRLKSSISGFTPNTGYAAIWMIASSECAELYVSGVNFMRKPYASDYHSHLKDNSELIALIEKFGNHNPDLDLESFRQLHQSGNIVVDQELADILKQPVRRLFYQSENIQT